MAYCNTSLKSLFNGCKRGYKNVALIFLKKIIKSLDINYFKCYTICVNNVID